MNINSRRVLGIDCGTAIVGWSILDKIGRDYRVIDYGDIRTLVGTKLSIRLMQIYDSIIKIIEKYQPGEMAVGYFSGSLQ